MKQALENTSVETKAARVKPQHVWRAEEVVLAQLANTIFNWKTCIRIL